MYTITLRGHYEIESGHDAPHIATNPRPFLNSNQPEVRGGGFIARPSSGGLSLRSWWERGAGMVSGAGGLPSCIGDNLRY